MNFPLNFFKNILALWFLTSGIAYSQCGAGEVEVYIDLVTDTWGWEMYWELVPHDSACGGSATIFAAGNQVVGCSNFAGTSSGADAGALASSTTFTYPDTGTTGFCLTIGNEYDIILSDDFGDGFYDPDGTEGFKSIDQGIDWYPYDATYNTNQFVYTFTAQLKPDNNLVAGVPVSDPGGWVFDYSKPVNFYYQPVSQLRKTETTMGIAIANYGKNDATNVVATLNIDINNSGNWSNVYTDTLMYGTLESDSVTYDIKPINDTSWYNPGAYRFQYIISSDSIDDKSSNDTITDFFNLTSNYFSKVKLTTMGNPSGDQRVFPTAGAQGLEKFEWGSLFYFPEGAGLFIDTLKVYMYAYNANNLTTPASVQARVYKIDVPAGDSLDMSLTGTSSHKQLVGIAVGSLSVTPGLTVLAKFDTIYDLQSLPVFRNLELQDNSIYYVSVYQEQFTSPYLSFQGTINGLAFYSRTINHDYSILNDDVQGYPYYNPLMKQDVGSGGVEQWFEYGFGGGPEPSMGIYLKSIVTNSTSIENELKNVSVTPNPTSETVNVSVNLKKDSDIQYIVTDTNGRIIYIENTNDVSSEVKTFDISKFPVGVFFIHVTTNEGRTTKRVIKK